MVAIRIRLGCVNFLHYLNFILLEFAVKNQISWEETIKAKTSGADDEVSRNRVGDKTTLVSAISTLSLRFSL